MNKPGRPRTLKHPVKLRGLYLDERTVAMAKKLGDGNLSAGVRRAVIVAFDGLKALGEL